MNLARFCHIRSDFNPEAGKSTVGSKCHQLRYLLRSVNDSESKSFDLGPTDAFDEEGISTHSLFFCVRQYNMCNPEKFRIESFVMANSTHYFVRNIAIYQGNNLGNIDIHARSSNLPTTIKEVVNVIITECAGNDPNGARKLCF